MAARTSRRRQSEPDDAYRVPEVPWPRLYGHLRRTWQPGEHATLLGPTRAGKTFLALELARMSRYSLVIATKRRDELVQALHGQGYVVVQSLEEVPRAADTGRPVWNRVLLWVNPSTRDERRRLALQETAIRSALATAERQGGWTIVLDETMWLATNLGLARELDSLWFQAASSKVSVVALAQRPSRIPRMMVSQATQLFAWQFSDRRDLEILRELGGSPDTKIALEDNLPRLSFTRHEFLWANVRTGEIARSVVTRRR